MPDIGWTLVACEPTPVATGASECGDRPFATSFVDAGDATAPELTFTVPDTYRAATALVAGILCFGGTPPDPADMLRAWPRASGCDDGRAQAVTFDVGVQIDDLTANQNPSLQDDHFELDGEPWLAPASDIDADCADDAGGSELPLVARASKKLEVTYASVGSDREPTGDGSGESLLLASFATGGKLERTFTVIEWKGAGSERTARLDWTLPSTLPKQASSFVSTSSLG